jgi:double-stranded uracil-DNA glycosylase
LAEGPDGLDVRRLRDLGTDNGWITQDFGLPPLEMPNARVLVLGSFPGAVSLRTRRYYAHPQNAFWPIMACLAGHASPQDPVALRAWVRDVPDAQRITWLAELRVSVWDVIAACQRPGSLDADIVRGTVKVNPIAALLSRCPGVRQIALNGGTAHDLFETHVNVNVPAVRMPSTSPAHAAMPFAEKLARWHAVLSG